MGIMRESYYRASLLHIFVYKYHNMDAGNENCILVKAKAGVHPYNRK